MHSATAHRITILRLWDGIAAASQAEFILPIRIKRIAAQVNLCYNLVNFFLEVVL